MKFLYLSSHLQILGGQLTPDPAFPSP